uniref:Ig-like domain-containing protein n=1 Tax=Heterorhabditis bacteriophora TaxID=37862 RepID=A0A1I7X1V2_HETBA
MIFLDIECLEDIVSNVGELITKLSCGLDGIPTPRVMWFKDEKELSVPSVKYDSNFTEGLAELIIKNIEQNDEGSYTCQAINELGSITTKSKLLVEAEKNYTKKTKTEKSSTTKKKKVAEKPITKEEEICSGSPNFHHQLEDCSAKIGQSKILCVTNTTLPEPTVEWFHNGNHVNINKSNYIRKHDKGRYELEILSVEKADEGNLWEVIGKNAFGECSSSCYMTVEVLDDQHAPVFDIPLSDIRCEESELLKLDVKISANPVPEIIWYADLLRSYLFCNDNEIHHSNTYRLQYDDIEGKYSLTIISAYAENSGEYKCVAKNHIGMAQTICYIRIDEHESKRSKKIDDSKAPKFRMHLINPREVSRKSIPLRKVLHLVILILIARADVDNDYAKPKFVQFLTNISAVEGNEVVLECCVTGKPNPAITW